MSVITAKRHLAKSEFEHTFSLYYSDSRRILNKVPKRRRKYICNNLIYLNNSIYNDLIIIQIHLFSRDKDKKSEKQFRIQQIFEKIEYLEKAIMIYSNIMQMPFDKQCNWSNTLNKEIKLLNGMVDDDSKKFNYKIDVLDWKAIHKFKVLDTMCELHRYVHGKAVRAVNVLENGETPLIIDLIDEAFYSLMKANTLYPKNKEEYKERLRRTDRALECLKAIQRPMLLYFNVMKYSNRVMCEWSKLLETEMRLLKGLQKSDKKHFSKLS